jgi:hypothetical protein
MYRHQGESELREIAVAINVHSGGSFGSWLLRVI